MRQTCFHAANCKTRGRKTAGMAVEAVTARSCATNRSIGAGRAGRRAGRRASFASAGRGHLRANAIIGILYKTPVFIMPSSPSPHLNSASCASTGVAPPPGLRMLDQVREQVRYLHYSIRTEQAYVHWVRAYVRFQGMRHPRQTSADEVRAFLT